jgi:ATP-binding cassette subfamily C exporter for protease/lipase
LNGINTVGLGFTSDQASTLAPRVETLGAVTLGGGANTIRVNASANDATAQLTIGTLTRTNNATLFVLGTNMDDPISNRRGDIVLTNVFADAPGRDIPILQNINLSVPAGTITAILGPSGSGKSTLARVLLGIWPDVTGQVSLNGLPIAGWNRIELGPYLGYLPQDVELLEGTIAENIARFGEVDSQLVIEAAQNAGLHEMILRFPKGYDTSIGEAGNMLSGGQRQRIGLARAIYGNPVFIVLDEPNANLDDAGEAALLKTVQLLKAKGTTVFLITHRPGAVAVADRILMLRDGQVQADGPRDAVLAALQAARQPPASPAPDQSALPA